MKKRLLLFVFLLMLPLVSAQDIEIFGGSYPLILVAPFFLMSAVLFFFLVIVIKDYFKKLRKIRINFLSNLFKRKKKNREKEEKSAIDFNSNLNSLGRKLKKLGNREGINQISELAKEIIKYKFDIKNEFTLEEVYALIRGHDKEIKLANRLSELKYSDKAITNEDVHSLYSELHSLLEKHSPVKTTRKKVFTNFGYILQKIKDLRHKKERHMHEEIKKEVKPNLKIPKPEKIKPEYIEIKPKKEFFLKKLFEKNELRLEEKKLIKKQKHIDKPEISKYRLNSEKRKLTHLLYKIQKLIKKNKLELAKKFFSESILIYYKLPLEQEELFASRINLIGKKIKTVHPEREFHEITGKILKLKEQGKVHSHESLAVVNQFKDFIERELVSDKKQTPLQRIQELPKLETPKIEVLGPRFRLHTPEVNITPSKRVPLTIQKLIKEENQVYQKLDQLQLKELERFKRKHPVAKPRKLYTSKYHEFLKKIEPKEHKSKKLDTLSEQETKLRQKLLEVN